MSLSRIPSSSSSLDKVQAQQEDSQPIMIHADGLPCLKRQQLENLCIRLGVKSTGKKSELIARLEGFAMGKSASVMSQLNDHQEPIEQQDNKEAIKENDEARKTIEHQMEEENEEEENDIGDISMLPNTASIRVISKPRESHFVSAMPDPFEMEVGVVLPRSGSSQGSLTSLASLNNRSMSGSKQNLQDKQLPTVPKLEQSNKAEEKPAKRVISGSSLYPWKKLIAGRKASCESLSKKHDSNGEKNSNQGEAQPSPAEMGLGLTASDSQASISSTVRKWLKGEGTSSITPSFPSNRRITRSVSAASSIINTSNPEQTKGPLQQEIEKPQSTTETPISKRKRKSGDDDITSYDDCSMPTSPEVPQRRIKPRPSRAKRSIATNSMEAATSPSAQEKVWTEMQARMAAKAKETEEGQKRKVSNASSNGSGAQTPLLPPSPLKSVNSRTKGRFSSQHDKQFGRMDSIASHYAARRDASNGSGSAVGRARKVSEALEEDKEVEKQAVKAKRARIDDTNGNKEKSPMTNKTITIAPSNPSLPQRTDEERAAIKRKLELARHRRRSSTAAARASSSATTARRAAASHAGPSSKLSNHIKAGGFASKISFAVRGFMGAAARGLSNNSTITQSSSPSIEKVKEKEAEKISISSMGPPATPSIGQKSPEKKTSTPMLSTNSPSKPSSALSKKRSTFDLQASLARKPTGYTPYSAKETVGLLNSHNATSPMKPSTVNTDSSSFSRSSSINFPSSSPVKKSISKMESEEDVENQEPQHLSSVRSTPTSPRIGAVKKTRSSASHSARSSIRTGRKSTVNVQTNAARVSARSSTNNKNPSNLSRKRNPSLQSVNQTMAKEMINARRSRTNAITNDFSRRPIDRSNANDSNISTLNSSIAPSAAGHGSPRKLGGSSAFVQGKGRGKSSLIENGSDSITSTQPQRKRSTQASSMRS